MGVNYYYQTESHFPRGAIENDRLPLEQRLSWLVIIMPYIESTDSYKLDKSKPWDNPANLPIVKGEFSWFICPDNPNRTTKLGVGITHYVGLEGIGSDAGHLPADNQRAGLFSSTRTTIHADVKRGLANTALAIETLRDNGPWAAGGFATVRSVAPESLPYLGLDGQFGGKHESGIPLISVHYLTNCLFADGSVRNLSDTVGHDTFRKMCTLADTDD